MLCEIVIIGDVNAQWESNETNGKSVGRVVYILTVVSGVAHVAEILRGARETYFNIQ